MDALFEAINSIFSFITPVSDFIWDFPTNFAFWSNIPLLGNFSLAIILLVGSGIFFSIKTGFIQLTHFKSGLKTLVKKNSSKNGISPLASFFLSSAMRVGPGNILGVTGAISVGGPGALFWMWVSAFFGMATAYIESTLSQIFKEKKDDEYVGGLPFYGRRLLGGAAWAGVALSVLYILYALCCFPAQGFNTVTAVGQMAEIITGSTIASDSLLYWVSAVIIIIATAFVAFGGIKKVTKVTDRLVPVMAVIYCVTVLVLIIVNFNRVPLFFMYVFGDAFSAQALAGGVFGTVLAQGVKRGLMSNEAGQGTITMAAAASNADHPSEQGMVQALGVFLDTMVICTLTGFVVVMAHCWTGADAESWMELGKLPKFLASVTTLSPMPAFNSAITFLISLCFGLFAYTCLIGFISFSEISATRISRSRGFINAVRIICLVVIAFGMMCQIAGYDLGNLWAFSDLGNILIVFANIPLLYLGCKYAFRSTRHYKKHDGTSFTSEIAGVDVPLWDERAKEMSAEK